MSYMKLTGAQIVVECLKKGRGKGNIRYSRWGNNASI